MSLNSWKSVDRAINLLHTPRSYADYISIKIKPISSGCCCFHCWPETWEAINEHIYPDGPIQDEGDVLLRRDDTQFVLECHESGPDIVVYLGVAVVTAGLVKSLVDLIALILQARQQEKRAVCRYKITTSSEGAIVEEIEVEIPSSDDLDGLMKKYIESIFIKKGAAYSTTAKVHPNIDILTERMETALSQGDYAAVLHASASIFETMAKDIVSDPSVQDKTLKRFFEQYRKDSLLPDNILDYILDTYNARNTTPLAGHGSTGTPIISPEQATTLVEITKAFVRIEYQLQKMKH